MARAFRRGAKGAWHRALAGWVVLVLMCAMCDAGGKHSCATEPILVLEDGECVFERSCVGVISRSGACSTVRRLELFSMSLTAFAADVFAGLTGLQSLYLSDNDISELPEGAYFASAGAAVRPLRD